MVERKQRLAPFISRERTSPETSSSEAQTDLSEWREESAEGTLVYKREHGFVKIYKEQLAEDGSVTLEYLPHESLDFAQAEVERIFPPLAGSVLNFLIR